ncbi:MAG: hypothetical protein IT344_02780 [Candidatus Dadabacteria bacterium]|nr:hypothetical protein [Candidatus Dadabacteria bacterium]
MRHDRASIAAFIPRSEKWLARNREKLLTAAIWFLVVLGAPRLFYQTWRLLFKDGGNGANDLRLLRRWVGRWFEGDPFHGYIILPATFPTLWPITGWLPLQATKWLWLVLYVIAFWAFVRILKSGACVRNGRETALLALFVLTIYPTGVTIGNGQMTLLLLPAVVGALMISGQGGLTPWRRAAAVALLIFSSSKLPVTAPFFLILIITLKDFRTMTIVGVCYLLLTFFALHFRDVGVAQFAYSWTKEAPGAATVGGHGNIYHLLGPLGNRNMLLPASGAMLAALAVWLYKFRKTDFWVQVGVAAMVARLWTYHRLYDDLLIILPIAAMLRLLRNGELTGNERGAAAVIFAVSVVTFLVPGFFLQFPHPWGALFQTGQMIVWLSLLAFLLRYAYRSEKKKQPGRVETTSGIPPMPREA